LEVKVIRTVPEMQSWSSDLRRQGRSVGCVPTMGYLHAGHQSLIRESARRNDRTVMTLFVNPTQFAPHEDLSRYPRDFEGDCRKAAEAGAHVVFAPGVEDMYPSGYQTYVTVDEVSQGMEGAFRPTHFRGVATVVLKLFAATRPDVAFFGEKDYQQLAVIRRMVDDLHLGVEIIGMPTVREPDGLAMSSRNVYLKPEERRQALAISRALFAAQVAVKAGMTDPKRIAGDAAAAIAEAGLSVDYVEVREANTLAPLAVVDRPARILAAARIGNVRLIDNMAL